ncbi:cytochrome c oxidase subunit NDUFA4 [Leptopilina heterotoma]|uniref:cytochrome c oxidase subunit NDUFA4 n=1 Tax=Leptopilina heterotoma TaxID=63436 RepID=UPI001CAA0BDE|nr:cytochrome c oxidase subunit NDUFA4 [Leptopilina heterotoma]
MTYMQGLSLKSIKKHPALIPLYVVFAAGCLTSGAYLIRLAVKNPDVSWNLITNPEPWNEYKDKNYKILNPAEGRDTPKKMKSVFDY